jgi:hypothetical protein
VASGRWIYQRKYVINIDREFLGLGSVVFRGGFTDILTAWKRYESSI